MVLGIDFGTSNSAAAVIGPDGGLRPIALDGASNSMPTALFFDGGPVRFGSAALSAYLNENEAGSGRLMRGLKSLLGSKLIDEQTLLQGRMTSFFDILVLFLREIKARAERELGHAIDGAILGRPVHFVDDRPERDALAQATLQRAALAAGFTQVQFQLEPIAAAFDYEQRITQERLVLVVDIGGGTSDFTVMRLGPQRTQQAQRSHDVLATSGVHLGGTDFDHLLNLRYVMPLLGLGHLGPNGREVPSGVFFDLATWHLIHHAYSRKNLQHATELRSFYSNATLHQRLMRVLQQRQGHRILSQVEAAKIHCSDSSQNAELALDSIEPGLQAHMAPDTLAQTLANHVASIVACARSCVHKAGVPGVDVVYLTGGSSALAPLVAALAVAYPQAEMVHGDRFGGVAAGLAWQAAAMQR